MYITGTTVVLVCVTSTVILGAYGQTAVKQNICSSQTTCGACIRTPHCMWCSEEQDIGASDVGLRVRCMPRDAIPVKGEKSCRIGRIVNPIGSVDVKKNNPFSLKKDAQVQVKPQRVKMSLRVGESQSLKIQYQQANDYPVDLYYLMDLSASMEDHRDKLSKLGSKLGEAMKRLTSDFRLGFGSFIDKVVMPMTSTEKEWLSDGCTLKNKVPCAPVYAYKNQMPLDSKINLFNRNVQNAPISGNLDVPEGGLDAMMQAMVCWKEIGWRANARRILVYSSDAPYHVAGDGRLAGIVEPNDEQCHLNKDGFYTHAEILDYPSISQINKQVIKNDMNVIFAVVSKMEEKYKTLSTRINASSVGVLDEDSNNVLDLVLKQYEKLTNTVTMVDNATGLLELRYFSKCLNSGANAQHREVRSCNGVRKSTPLEFEVIFKAVDCPKREEDWHQTVEIKPQGLGESVIIEVNLICDCACSKQGHQNFEMVSEKCNGKGNLTCGICSCDEGYYGKQCSCNGTDVEAEKSMVKSVCRGGDKASKVDCNGQGQCLCGICVCNAGPKLGDTFYGDFCECDNFSCQRSHGLPCGGPDRGKCECGTCVCKEGLGGAACDCSTRNTTCMPPGEDVKLCNGFGDCECGKCNCHKGEGRSGQFCEECPTCPSQRCDKLKDCVECIAYKTGSRYEDDETCRDCDTVTVDLVDKIDNDPMAVNDSNRHFCPMPTSSGCSFIFTYDVESGRSDVSIDKVVAEKNMKCPEPGFSVYGVAGGAIALTIFIGLLILIIWKVLTMFHDHREWVKFEKERVCANWGRNDNPLFKEPTSTFKNPTFSGQQEIQ